MPLSQTESVARALLRHYLPKERFLYNQRPDFLKYPPTGRNLELDIWAPELHAAWEVQGVHHGRHIPGMQSTFEDFITQMSRDAFKMEACQRQGITLYTLTSFDLTQRRFEAFIRPLLTESDWRRIDPPLHLYARAEKLTRMKVTNRKRRKPGLIPLLQRTYRRLTRSQ